MDDFEGKNKRYRKQLTKFGETKFYEVSRGRAAMFVVNISRALSRDPSSDCAIPRAEVTSRSDENHFSTCKALNLFGICSDSFKLLQTCIQA